MNRPRQKNNHLPRCVYQKHGAYYFVKGGKWHPLGKSLREALTKYADLFDAPKGSMPELIGAALATILPKVATSTQSQYLTAGRKLSAAFVEFSPREVLPKHVAAFKVSMARTPNMGNRCLSVLRQVFDYALEHELADYNPAAEIKRHAEAKRDRLPTQAEYDAVYAKAAPRLQVIMELLRYGGQRTVDTLRIREADILEEGIRFRQQKTDAYLIVKWRAGLRAAVARARELQGPVRTLTLLSNRRRKAPDYRSVHLQFVKACEAAKVDNLHLHDLRAMAATQAEAEGKNPTTLLGHSSPQNTRRYLRGREAKLVEGPSFGHPKDSAEK